MTSERQKREEEIERLMRGAEVNRESDVAFQEQVRKAASTIIQEQESKIRKSEPVKRGERSIHLATAGLWLLVLGAAALVLSLPSVAGVLLVCGVAAIVWDNFPKSPKK
jgi:Flp pilus assembly protein TadB